MPYCDHIVHISVIYKHFNDLENCTYNIILITNTHAAPQDMLNMNNVVRKTQGGHCVNKYISVFQGNCGCNFVFVFRWFKYTLKPPYSIMHGKLRLAIWDTSFWTFWSNLDTRDLETYPRTYFGHFLKYVNF